jgi:hypothetical protein
VIDERELEALLLWLVSTEEAFRSFGRIFGAMATGVVAPRTVDAERLMRMAHDFQAQALDMRRRISRRR